MANVPPDLIYLENQATTPTDPRVLDAMLPFLGSWRIGVETITRFGHTVRSVTRRRYRC